MARHFDAIVIGTGQAGPPMAVRLAQAGKKVAVIERGRFGGTCVNTGCIPTKALVASARVAHLARRAGDYGVLLDAPPRIDMRRVKARKDAVVRQSMEGVANWLKNTPNVTVITGHAAFTAPRTLLVNGAELSADRIFINVGARAAIPGIPGLDDSGYLTNSTVLDLDVVPPHLAVLGAGPVGLEFAQIYRRFGSDVTVIDSAPQVAMQEDEEVSLAIRRVLEREGVRFVLEAGVQGVSRRSDGLALALDGGDEVLASHLLLATGRKPNTDDLGLDRAGIATDARGHIEVNEQLQTNVPDIWALGEVNGRGAFTHTSYNDYEIVAANLFGPQARSVAERIPAYALFTDPPLGRVGLNEREVRKAGHKALVGKIPMSRVARARARGETDGFMSVLIDQASDRLLGAAIFGIEGDEAIHCFLDIMQAGAPYTVLQRAMHIHPTVSELIPTLLGNLKPLA